MQDDPDRPEYKIALERAIACRRQWTTSRRARIFEEQGRLDEALREYRQASEFDPSNRSIAAQGRRTRPRAARPARGDAAASGDRADARAGAAQHRRSRSLNPSSRDPLSLRFANTSLRDLLNFIGSATGINVTYDRDFQDRTITVQLEGVTLEQALQQIMVSNQIFYKVLNDRTIIVATDNTQKRQQYEEQVIRRSSCRTPTPPSWRSWSTP